MNAESFIQYLNELSRLYQLPYQELKSLSMEHPYFQNVHLLLALKSKLEDHPDYPKNLARASTYSSDRAQLYRTLTRLEKLVLENDPIFQEEVLELEDLKAVEHKLKDLELIEKEEEPLAVKTLNSPLPSNTTKEFTELIDKDTQTSEEPELEIPSLAAEQAIASADEEIPQATASPSFQIDAEIIGVISTVLKEMPGPVKVVAKRTKTVLPPPVLDIEKKKQELKQLKTVKPKKPRPMPKQSFSSWVEQFQPAYVKPHLGELMETKKKEILNMPSSIAPQEELAGDNLHVYAEISVTENDDMASETLAELLVAQMQYKKAIDVYQRLSLIFPEKSLFFAEKIENLKKLVS
ncbi:MAG: hypothetical protein AAF242_04065 [Bacteroidota bacterium]